MTCKLIGASRREFLRQAGAMAGLGVGAPLALNLAAMGAASAQTASDYKAIVCIFMYGGNDAYNTVLATDSSSWQRYAAVRPSSPGNIGLLKDGAADRTKTVGSAAWMGSVLPISPATAQPGRSFALNPMLGDVKAMFDAKRLAVVANVGPLVEPVTRSQYLAKAKATPRKLFSHNDQQSTWQTFQPEGASSGWGGRMADLFASSNGNSIFTSVNAGDNSAWSTGRVVKQYRMGVAGPVRLGLQRGADGVDRVYGFDSVAVAMRKIVQSQSSSHVMLKDHASVATRSLTAQEQIAGLLPGAATAPFGPASALNCTLPSGATEANALAAQLQVVARTIAIQSALGVKRQVFFVNLGGFDTHANQPLRHATLMTQLNHGLKYFDTVLNSLGVANQVTTFTASDFGRTFTSNGDGTDHGWGGHHFVMGGAVAGGDLYGAFPVYGDKASNSNDFMGTEDQIYNGALVPKIAVDQYAATIANWFGVPSSSFGDIFPNSGNFSTRLDLGFMRS